MHRQHFFTESRLAKRFKTTPRKLPQQSRSQETVDAILAATSRLLVTSGYDTMSTNRIAIAAGVSIGSLYQYFPSKEAIVAALVEGHCSAAALASQATLTEHVGSTVEVAARAVVEAMVAAKTLNPRLHRALREQVPRVGKLNFVDTQHAETAAVVTRYLISRSSELPLEDPELTAFIAVKTVDALLQQLDHPVMSSRGEAKVTEEIVNLLVAYLTRGRS